MTEPFDPPELELGPEGMVIQIWVPNMDDGAKVARLIRRNFWFYEVPELAEWHNDEGHIMTIAPYDVSKKGGDMEP